MKEFNYRIADRAKSVVVIGGGPSALKRLNEIKRYITQNNSLVITANYEFPQVKSSFVYFTDRKMFMKQMPRIKTDQIIINILVKDLVRRLPQTCRQKHKFYYIGRRDRKVVYHCSEICRDEKGTYHHSSMGTAGFGAIAVATLLKPTKILIVGFDGPSSDLKSKTRFDGKVITYKRSISSTRRRKKYFVNKLLPWVVSQGIQLEFFKGDKLWGADRSIGVEHE